MGESERHTIFDSSACLRLFPLSLFVLLFLPVSKFASSSRLHLHKEKRDKKKQAPHTNKSKQTRHYTSVRGASNTTLAPIAISSLQCLHSPNPSSVCHPIHFSRVSVRHRCVCVLSGSMSLPVVEDDDSSSTILDGVLIGSNSNGYDESATRGKWTPQEVSNTPHTHTSTRETYIRRDERASLTFSNFFVPFAFALRLLVCAVRMPLFVIRFIVTSVKVGVVSHKMHSVQQNPMSNVYIVGKKF